MKKILYILIGLLIVPTFVFAAEKEIGTMEKFYEDSEYEYYFYGQKSSEVKIMADGWPDITVEEALKNGEDISKIKTLISKPIYGRKKESKDLIVSSNVIKYSIRGEEDVLIDYYLYLEELGNEDTYCDKEKTICFDPSSKIITLNEFEGENLYISEVDTDNDDKLDEIKIVVKGNNVISSKGESVALNIDDNPVVIESDKKDNTISSDYSSLYITTQAIGIGTSAKLSLKNIQLNVYVGMVSDIEGVFGVFGVNSDLELDNVTFYIDLGLEGSNINKFDENGMAIGLMNSNVTVKNESMLLINSIASGIKIDNIDSTKEFNVNKDSMVYISTDRETDSNLEDIAFSLTNVKMNNHGMLMIYDTKNTKYTVEINNTEFNNEYAFVIESNAYEAALYALSSKLNINGELFMITNDREEKSNEVNSMLLDKSELKISEDLKKTPSEFATDSYNCIAVEGSSCKTGTIYTDNSIRAVITSDKLVDEDLDITVLLPEKVEKFIYMNAYDEKHFEEDEWFNSLKGNLEKSVLLKFYRVIINSDIDDEVILPDGNYKIYIPVPSDLNKYDPIKIMTVKEDEKKLDKELKYTKSEDGKYFVVELTKEELGNNIDLIITGDEIKQVSTGQVIIGTSIFGLVLGFGAIVYKTKKKRKMFSI